MVATNITNINDEMGSTLHFTVYINDMSMVQYSSVFGKTVIDISDGGNGFTVYLIIVCVSAVIITKFLITSAFEYFLTNRAFFFHFLFQISSSHSIFQTFLSSCKRLFSTVNV